MSSDEVQAETERWRQAELKLADDYYKMCLRTENKAIEATNANEPENAMLDWAVAGEQAFIHQYLCDLVHRLDPRPGAPEGPAKPL